MFNGQYRFEQRIVISLLVITYTLSWGREYDINLLEKNAAQITN